MAAPFVYQYQYYHDRMPKRSVFYTPPEHLVKQIKAIDARLSLGWWTKCLQCGRELPGDFHVCDFVTQNDDGTVTQCRNHNGHVGFSGFWRVYQDVPMEQDCYSPTLGVRFRVVTMAPRCSKFKIEQAHLTSGILALGQMYKPTRNDAGAQAYAEQRAQEKQERDWRDMHREFFRDPGNKWLIGKVFDPFLGDVTVGSTHITKSLKRD